MSTVSHQLGYIKYEDDVSAAQNVGTAGTGLTATEEQKGFMHRTTLRITTAFTLSPAGAAAEALGHKLYTFPTTKKCLIDKVYLYINVSGSTADTPELGVGTITGSGANATLGAVDAKAENCLGGVATSALNTAGGVNIERGEVAASIVDQLSGEVYLNIADTWAGAQTVTFAKETASVNGKIVILWYEMN
jgi:hypothetical protein